MTRFRAILTLSLISAAAGASSVAVLACDTETATTAVVVNEYPDLTDGGDTAKQVVVYKAWWVTTLFTEAVLPAATSSELRTVPVSDTAYALLAPGWDPGSATPPVALIPVRSKTQLSVNRGDVLQIKVSDATFRGNCAANQALSQEDADFMTQRIFPGEFAGRTYDARTCTATTAEADDGGANGSDAGRPGGGDSGTD